MKARIYIAFTLIAAIWASPALAELDESLISDGWDEIKFEELSENTFTALDDTQGLSRSIQVYSEDSSSVAFLNIDVNLNETPKLEWSWQSLTPTIDTDTTVKGGDDRTLSVYIAFPYQPEEASFSDKFRRTTVELLRGSDTPDRVLTYIWGGGASQGDRLENPYTGRNGKFIYLRTPEDAHGQWFDERVDVRQDFIEAFGFEPAAPVYIAIASDSDDTDTIATAQVRGIRFTE